MDFTNHTVARICVSEFLKQFCDLPCPHIDIVLHNAKLSLAKLIVKSNWVLHFLSTVNNLLTKNSKPTRSLNPLVFVAFHLLDGRVFGVLRRKSLI